MKDSNIRIIEHLKTFLENARKSKEKYCVNEKSFVRVRLLSFSVVVYMIINLTKKSLSVELDHFFDFLSEGKVAGKSSFSKARYRLKHQFFMDWNKELVNIYYQEKEDDLKVWEGFKIYGIDGSTMYLLDSKDISEEFGVQKSDGRSVPMARIMACYDVLNDLCISSKISKITTDELSVALEWADTLPENSLSIYDRNFASFILIYVLTLRKKDFVIRCKTTFNNVVKTFVKSKKHSTIVDIPVTDIARKRCSQELGIVLNSKATVRVRLVAVKLKTGEIEVLITSLMCSKKHPTKSFKALYFMRWGVEVYFDRFKNKFQAECFCGHKAEAIYQEFYAMVFTSNLQSLIINDCEPELKKDNQKRMHEYKINRNVSLGLMKDKIIELFISEEPEEIWGILKTKFLRHTVPIIPERSEPRKKRKSKLKGKYKTVLNYRRAI